MSLNQKLLFPFAITTAMLVSACGEQNPDRPVDGRDFDGVNYTASDEYSGQVFDGYLKNAFVWLDIDGDGLYTSGTVTVDLPSGNQVVLSNGEPSVLSGENGNFTLDVSALRQDPLVAPSLNPRDYRLWVQLLPGQTVEQSRSGDVVLDQAHRLVAPAGVRIVTPLTTLEVALRDSEAPSSFLRSALNGVNTLADYIQSDNARAQAYAQALSKFMAELIPVDIASQVSTGRERLLDADAQDVLRETLVSGSYDARLDERTPSYGEQVIALVDEAAGGRYANVDINALALPSVTPDLTNPLVIASQLVKARPDSGATEYPVSLSRLQRSSRFDFVYDESGRLSRVNVQGCLQPDMHEMTRLANVGGRMGELDTQWMPGVTLSPESKTRYDEEGLDEQLRFDWENNTAYFDSNTNCLPSLFTPATSESLADDVPELTFTWTLDADSGRVTSMTQGNRAFMPEYADATSTLLGYRIEVNSADAETRLFNGSPASCEGSIAPEDAGLRAVVSARQTYDLTLLGSPANALASGVADFDARTITGQTRLTRYDLVSGYLMTYPEVYSSSASSEALTWQFAYQATPTEEDVTPPGPQSPLIVVARLKEYESAGTCGIPAIESPEANLYADVLYEYLPLATLLARNANEGN